MFGIDDAFELKRVEDPVSYFDIHGENFQEIVEMVRASFGSLMTEKDIYNHLINPAKLFLAKNGGIVVVMYAYTPINLLGERVLYIDGVAVHPQFQARGIFSKATLEALDGQKIIGLRTQNPQMHRALEKFCHTICPSRKVDYSLQLIKFRDALADFLGMEIDSRGVSRGFYGKSLYPIIPFHQTSSALFETLLKVDYALGDSVVCVGLLRDEDIKEAWRE